MFPVFFWCRLQYHKVFTKYATFIYHFNVLSDGILILSGSKDMNIINGEVI